MRMHLVASELVARHLVRKTGERIPTGLIGALDGLHEPLVFLQRDVVTAPLRPQPLL
jgi:hypothetical protein